MSKLLEQINKTRKTIRLGDLVLINNKSISNKFLYSEIEYIDTASVYQNNFDNPQILKINEAPSRAKRLVENGDTILSTVRPNLRHFGFIKNPKENTVVSTGFVVLTPKLIDPFYLYSYLTKDSVTRTLSAIAEATTTTFPAFRPEILSEMEVEIPDLHTQKKIAGILSAYDSKIENNNKIIKNLETTAQTIFTEWFVKFRFPGYEKVKFVDSEMGEIPDGWAVGSIRNIFEINPPTKVTEIVDAPYVEMRDLSESNMTFCFKQRRKPTNGSRFKNHDTLMARITPCLENGKTGYANCLEDAEVGVGSTEFLVLRPKDSSFREFTYLLARSELFRNFAIGRMVGSSGRQRVSAEDIARFKFVKPESNVINKFHKLIVPMVDIIKAYSEENISLKSQRDQLLAKLI